MKNAQVRCEEATRRLAGALDKHYAKSYDDVGAYECDYNTVYGGAVIAEITNTSGAISHPFGMMRRKPQDFIDTINFTLHVISELKS